MNNSFLQSYTIPTITSNAGRVVNYNDSVSALVPPPPPPANLVLGYYAEGGLRSEANGTLVNYPQYQHPHRYLPPGHTKSQFVRTPTKRKYDAGPSATGSPAKQTPIAETTSDGKLVIFKGRDTSYPDELNKLIHPLHCELCMIQLNSPHSAKDHYESKVHDRHLTSWISRNYTQKGLDAPNIKHFLKQGPTGPDAFHCELCDLKLTSLTHANQHYSGRKHRLVASKVSKPSGVGYYDADGKWVRVATKPTVSNDGRFGIGESFKNLKTEEVSSKQDPATTVTSPATDATTTTVTTDTEKRTIENGDENMETSETDAEAYESLFCKVCQITVTSAVQMQMHLVGAKHRKKLKLISTEVVSNSRSIAIPIPTPASDEVPPEIVSPASIPVTNGITNLKIDSILDSLNEKREAGAIDWSMYRTPAGLYYCKVCNISLGHVSVLQQHLLGRKHIKFANEEKAKKPANSNKV